jgi:hypothetical protein
MGASELNEGRYGLLVLDELGSWLNAREWADKGRQQVIDWLIHSRKRRWDVVFVVQHVSMIDKQVREALLEFLVQCKRLDRIAVPIFGFIGRFLTFGAWDGKMPKVHLAIVLYMAGSSSPQGALVSERWLYRGATLYGAYDTEQVFFQVRPEAIAGKGGTHTAGPFSYLTPWHVLGRYLKRRTFAQIVRAVAVWLGMAYPERSPQTPPAQRLAPLLRVPSRARRWELAAELVRKGAH